MQKVVHIRKVTPKRFADWLEKQTTFLYRKKFPTEKGIFTLQRASASNDFSRVSINAAWVSSSTGEVVRSDDSIVFELVQLDDERTEIMSICDNESSTIPIYFEELLAEIEQRWKAEYSESTTEEEVSYLLIPPTLDREFTFNGSAKEVRDFMIGDTENHPRKIEWTDGFDYFVIAHLWLDPKLDVPVKNKIYGGRITLRLAKGNGTDAAQLKEDDWLINGREVYLIGISQTKENECKASLFYLDSRGWFSPKEVDNSAAIGGIEFVQHWWRETIIRWQTSETTPSEPLAGQTAIEPATMQAQSSDYLENNKADKKLFEADAPLVATRRAKGQGATPIKSGKSNKPKPQARIQASINQLSRNRVESINETGKIPELKIALEELGDAAISRKQLYQHAYNLVANWKIKSYRAVWRYDEDKEVWEVSE